MKDVLQTSIPAAPPKPKQPYTLHQSCITRFRSPTGTAPVEGDPMRCVQSAGIRVQPAQTEQTDFHARKRDCPRGVWLCYN